MDGTQVGKGSGDKSRKNMDITQIVDPQEIDFESIFGDLSWNDESKSLASVKPERKVPPAQASLPPPDEELSVTNIIEMHLRAEELGDELRRKNKKLKRALSIVLIIFALLLIIFIKPELFSKILDFVRLNK